MSVVGRLAGIGFAIAVLGSAGASIIRGATLSADIRSTTNTQAARPAVQALIAAQVAKLSEADLQQQALAREALVAEVLPAAPNQPQPSQLFLDLYAETLAGALKPLAKHSDPRVRLNVAIAAARVAERVNDDRLAPLILDLLDDKSQAVALWAIKGAHFVIAPVLSSASARQSNQLLPALVKAAQENRSFGPIVLGAYESLRLYATGANAPAPEIWPQIIPLVVDRLQGLLEVRIADYAKGIPAMPAAETTATSFLVDGKVWAVEPPAQRLRTAQLMADLLSVAAQRWESVSLGDRADLATLTNKVSDGLWVVANAVGNEQIKQAVQTKVSPNTPPADVLVRANTIRTAIKSVPQFSQLKDPPTLPKLAPASAPSSAPAGEAQ